MKDLGVEYLDLYLIHFPIALKYVDHETRYPAEWVHDPNAPVKCMEEDNVSIQETWTAMEELVKEGLVKNIGICNMNISLIRDMLNYSTIKPAVLQVELHPYLSQEKLLRFCKEHNIQVTGYSNFGASSYVEIGMATDADCCLIEESVIAIAAKHGKTAGQIALKWACQRGYAIIPKTTKVERMAENRNLFDFELTEEEMKTIGALNKNRRFNDPGNFTEVAFGTFFPIYE
jgi:D-xylose reductase